VWGSVGGTRKTNSRELHQQGAKKGLHARVYGARGLGSGNRTRTFWLTARCPTMEHSCACWLGTSEHAETNAAPGRPEIEKTRRGAEKDCMSECAERELGSGIEPDLLITSQTLHRGAYPVRVGSARRDMQRRDKRELQSAKAAMMAPRGAATAPKTRKPPGPAASRREDGAAAPLGEPIFLLMGRRGRRHRDGKHYRRLDRQIKINFASISQLEILPGERRHYAACCARAASRGPRRSRAGPPRRHSSGCSSPLPRFSMPAARASSRWTRATRSTWPLAGNRS
jgi:hypothetical protein